MKSFKGMLAGKAIVKIGTRQSGKGRQQQKFKKSQAMTHAKTPSRKVRIHRVKLLLQATFNPRLVNS
jgi:hypothetical protein